MEEEVVAIGSPAADIVGLAVVLTHLEAESVAVAVGIDLLAVRIDPDVISALVHIAPDVRSDHVHVDPAVTSAPVHAPDIDYSPPAHTGLVPSVAHTAPAVALAEPLPDTLEL